MSEPMTTVEIEDVLFSIRRLVSEDLRPTHKLVSAALQNGAAKLLLTPALRIVSDIRSAQPERDDGADEPRNLETVLHDIEAETETGFVDALPVFGSIRLTDPILAASEDMLDASNAAVTDANFLTTAMSRINGLTSGDSGAANQAETIEAVVAAVGAAVGPDEWELDGGEPAPQSKAWADTNWSADVNADAGQAQSDPLGTIQSAGSDAQPAQDSGETVAVPGADSIVFHDTVVAEAESAAQDDADDADENAGFVSEELLREIVRDMIRDELQGTLGERITRNVRKLVRAEINRALASRDFDDIASRG